MDLKSLEFSGDEEGLMSGTMANLLQWMHLRLDRGVSGSLESTRPLVNFLAGEFCFRLCVRIPHFTSPLEETIGRDFRTFMTMDIQKVSGAPQLFDFIDCFRNIKIQAVSDFGSRIQVDAKAKTRVKPLLTLV